MFEILNIPQKLKVFGFALVVNSFNWMDQILVFRHSNFISIVY